MALGQKELSQVESQLSRAAAAWASIAQELGRQVLFLCGCGWREGASRIYVCTERQL